MIYHDVPQGSEEWFELRKGIPTASRADMILTPGGKKSGQQTKLIAQLISEQLSLLPPERVESYTNRAMRHGEQTEHEARLWYSMTQDCQLKNGGHCRTDDNRFGCSPDSLVDGLGEAPFIGCLELKCPQPHTFAEYCLDNEGLLKDYRPQVHMHLIVTGLAWCDLVAYCPGKWSPIRLRVEPDEYTEALKEELERFYERYQLALRHIREKP